MSVVRSCARGCASKTCGFGHRGDPSEWIRLRRRRYLQVFLVIEADFTLLTAYAHTIAAIGFLRIDTGQSDAPKTPNHCDGRIDGRSAQAKALVRAGI